MNRNPGILIRVGPSLGRDVVLIGGAFSGHDVTALEHDGGVSEDEIDGAGDVGFSIELSFGESVECVLVPIDGASVYNGSV